MLFLRRRCCHSVLPKYNHVLCLYTTGFDTCSKKYTGKLAIIYEKNEIFTIDLPRILDPPFMPMIYVIYGYSGNVVLHVYSFATYWTTLLRKIIGLVQAAKVCICYHLRRYCIYLYYYKNHHLPCRYPKPHFRVVTKWLCLTHLGLVSHIREKKTHWVDCRNNMYCTINTHT